MTIQELVHDTAKNLKESGQIPDQAWLEAESLVAKATKRNKAWLIGHSLEKASTGLIKTANALAKRRAKGEPLAYLLGQAFFLGREFFVNRSTLIPRSETEDLVTRVKDDLKAIKGKFCLWDVGVGSGAIAISLALETNLPVIGSDRSKGALAMARKNSLNLIKAKPSRPKLIQGPLLTRIIANAIKNTKADHLVVVANLPYLPLSDKQALSPSVTKFEPHSALFSGQDGLTLIKQLLKQLKAWQQKTGMTLHAYLEFDPPQIETLADFVSIQFPAAKIESFADHCGRERFMKIVSVGQGMR